MVKSCLAAVKGYGGGSGAALLAISYWLLAFGFWLLAVGRIFEMKEFI